MFIKVTQSGQRRYAQLVESFRNEDGKPRQRTVCTPEFDSSRHFRHAYSNEINNLEAVFAFFCGGTFYAK